MRDTVDPNAPFDTRIERLLDQLRMLENDIDRSGVTDTNSQLLGRILDEACAALNESTENRLRQIDAALARMVDGDFGICDCCGARIGHERLEILPITTICAGCAT